MGIDIVLKLELSLNDKLWFCGLWQTVNANLGNLSVKYTGCVY